MYEIYGVPPEKKKSMLLGTYPRGGLGWQLAQKKAGQLEEEGYRNLKVVEAKPKPTD